jgi:hypothetical protein
MGNRARIDFYHVNASPSPGKRYEPEYQGGVYAHWFAERWLSDLLPYAISVGYGHEQIYAGWLAVVMDHERGGAASDLIRSGRVKVGNIYPVPVRCRVDQLHGLDAGHFKVVASFDWLKVFHRNCQNGRKWELVYHFTYYQRAQNVSE